MKDSDLAKNEYYVKDLYEASFLYALNLPLLRLDKQRSTYFFVFGAAEECKVQRDAYWSYNSSIDAKRYADAIRSLKERIFANER